MPKKRHRRPRQATWRSHPTGAGGESGSSQSDRYSGPCHEERGYGGTRRESASAWRVERPPQPQPSRASQPIPLMSLRFPSPTPAPLPQTQTVPVTRYPCPSTQRPQNFRVLERASSEPMPLMSVRLPIRRQQPMEMDPDGGDSDPESDKETLEEPKPAAVADADPAPAQDNNNDDEESDGSEEDNSSEDDDDDGGGDEAKKWLDVRDLRNLSLEEVKQMLTDESSNANATESVPSRKVDQPITKVIVRRLPPEITIKSYLEELPEMPTYNYIRMVPQYKDFPSRAGKRNSIYINFDKEEEAFWFKEKYNNMVIYDEYGIDYISCVDFSLVQDIAKDPEDDPLMGTLEDSSIYQEFLESYEEDPWAYSMVRPATIPTPEVMLDEILNRSFEENENTPLLQFLRNRSDKEDTERKSREERRRERDAIRRKQKEESARRKQKEKEEAKKQMKEKDESTKREKDKSKDSRRRERDRERQRERDKERRLRRDKERAAAAAERQSSSGQGNSGGDKVVESSKASSSSSTTNPSGKDGSKRPNEKDKDGKSFVTYSKTGNVTRWSENSGPKRNDKRGKDDPKRAAGADPKPSSSSSVPSTSIENLQSGSKSEGKGGESKSNPFGKPFPVKDNKESAGSSRSAAAADDKSKTDSSKKNPNEAGGGEKANKPNKESGGAGAGGSAEGGAGGNDPPKKRIVKKVIRVKKVSKENKEEGNNGNNDPPQDKDNPESTKPKRVVRVMRKSSKPEEAGAAAGGSSSKASTSAPKGEDSSQGGSKTASKTTTSSQGQQDGKGQEPDKDRKNRRGRPEIQIYRPGSLRAGGGGSNSGKPKGQSSSNSGGGAAAGGGGGGDKEKERSS